MDNLLCKICDSAIDKNDKRVTVNSVAAETINTLARQRGIGLVAAVGDIFHKKCQVQFTRKDRTFKKNVQGEKQSTVIDT